MEMFCCIAGQCDIYRSALPAHTRRNLFREGVVHVVCDTPLGRAVCEPKPIRLGKYRRLINGYAVFLIWMHAREHRACCRCQLIAFASWDPHYREQPIPRPQSLPAQVHEGETDGAVGAVTRVYSRMQHRDLGATTGVSLIHHNTPCDISPYK